MPAPLPPTALGISVGPAAAPVTIDIHIDMTCPFSKKIYDTMAKEVIPWVRATSPEKVSESEDYTYQAVVMFIHKSTMIQICVSV
jgi:hypothetical protein